MYVGGKVTKDHFKLFECIQDYIEKEGFGISDAENEFSGINPKTEYPKTVRRGEILIERYENSIPLEKLAEKIHKNVEGCCYVTTKNYVIFAYRFVILRPPKPKTENKTKEEVVKASARWRQSFKTLIELVEICYE